MNTDRIKELKEKINEMREQFKDPRYPDYFKLQTELQAREECQKEIDMLKERIELLKEQIWNYETLDDCTIVADKGEFKAIEETK
jgi:hypothetical protein